MLHASGMSNKKEIHYGMHKRILANVGLANFGDDPVIEAGNASISGRT